jgi:hypothetical protein
MADDTKQKEQSQQTEDQPPIERESPDVNGVGHLGGANSSSLGAGSGQRGGGGTSAGVDAGTGSLTGGEPE